jgi:hypothetical protein
MTDLRSARLSDHARSAIRRRKITEAEVRAVQEIADQRRRPSLDLELHPVAVRVPMRVTVECEQEFQRTRRSCGD